jgi:DeoR family fructose operon transcriptional repressor
MNFDLLFLGTNAIDDDGRLTTPNEDEARMKELMVERSNRVVLVSDTSKLSQQSFVQFAHLDDVDMFVTDRAVPDHRELFESSDVLVAVAD